MILYKWSKCKILSFRKKPISQKSFWKNFVQTSTTDLPSFYFLPKSKEKEKWKIKHWDGWWLVATHNLSRYVCCCATLFTAAVAFFWPSSLLTVEVIAEVSYESSKWPLSKNSHLRRNIATDIGLGLRQERVYVSCAFAFAVVGPWERILNLGYPVPRKKIKKGAQNDSTWV